MNQPLPALPPFADTTAPALPPVAISACLSGEAVRYDGTAKTLEGTLTFLAKRLRLIPICPEVGAGMTVPRPPVQLIETGDGVRALGRDDPSLDVTVALVTFGRHSLERYGQELCGYIFKSRSPSCGLGTTPVFSTTGEQRRLGSGLQADYFQRELPWLQMVDEHALAEREQCLQFVHRCQWLADVRRHSATDTLADLHHHYLPVIALLAASPRRDIESALREKNPQRYWQAFGTGLQALFS